MTLIPNGSHSAAAMALQPLVVPLARHGRSGTVNQIASRVAAADRDGVAAGVVVNRHGINVALDHGDRRTSSTRHSSPGRIVRGVLSPGSRSVSVTAKEPLIVSSERVTVASVQPT